MVPCGPRDTYRTPPRGPELKLSFRVKIDAVKFCPLRRRRHSYSRNQSQHHDLTTPHSSVFMTDITEQKRLEVKVQHTNKLEAVGVSRRHRS